MKYTIRLEDGNEAIVEADTIEAAELWARWEFGNSNVLYAKESTDDELAWYEAWNGIVHQAEPIKVILAA